MNLAKRLAYNTFRFSCSVKYRMLRRFTSGGVFLLAALLVTAFLGVDTNRTMAYQAFTLLFSLLIISSLSGFLFKGRFSIRRKLPKFGAAGSVLTYQVVIKNDTNRVQKGLRLMENLMDPRPSFQEFLNSREPGEEKRNLFDRTFAFYRWQWLLSQKKTALLDEQELADIQPGGEVEVRMKLTPLKRGTVRFTGATIARPDPFGLFNTFISMPSDQSLLILPRRYPTPSAPLPGARKYNQGGVAMASEVGDSEEFISLRDYRPGDPLRQIHWKSWARTGKPVVKEFQEEYFVRHALILDTFMEREHTGLFEEAVAVAASFASGVESRDTLLDLMFVSDEAYCFTSGRSLAHADRMLEILASVKVCVDKPFKTLRNSVMDRMSILSGCVCVLVSWDEERRMFIERLKSHGVFLLVLVIRDSAADPIPDPGPMSDCPENFRVLDMDKIAEGLAGIGFKN